MRKVKTLDNFVIAINKKGDHFVYTKDEWEYGEGFRYPEFECGQDIQEAIDNIESY